MALEPAMDWQQLHDLSGNDAAFEEELLRMFIADTEEQLDQLGVAIATNDRRLAQHIAHHIKGAAANVGAIAISSQSAQLEQGVLEVDRPSLSPALIQIYEQLRPALEHLRQSI